jgi:hypothetical protein
MSTGFDHDHVDPPGDPRRDGTTWSSSLPRLAWSIRWSRLGKCATPGSIRSAPTRGGRPFDRARQIAGLLDLTRVSFPADAGSVGGLA